MGFMDFVYKQVNPDERRWRREAQQEAKEYRQDAKEFFQEAKDLYEDDYKEYKRDAQRLSNQLGDLIRRNNEYKASLLKELGGNITASIANFKRFNIDSKVIKSIKLDSGDFSGVSLTASLASFSPPIVGTFNPISLVFSALSDPFEDRDKAYSQRSKAQEYLWQVQDAVSQMKATIEELRNTKTYIEDEKQTLDDLMGKIRQIINQLNTATTKESYTENEAQYMKGICRIAELIKNTLESQITNKSGDISSNYKKYSDKIRKINRAIPSAPTITQSGNWLEKIIQY